MTSGPAQRAVHIVAVEDLPATNFSHELIGDDQGGTDVSLILVEAPPGGGPSLHSHPYDEIFVRLSGEALFVAGDTETIVGPGHVVVVPAGMPHRFENIGSEPLRQVDIHSSPHFVTDWLNGSTEDG
jgi:mannose-6-phosphate isomerase-like protein (cupin superfamily)